MRVDFHMHSAFSDGSCSPEDLLQRVIESKLKRFAVTDHDCLELPRRWRHAGVERMVSGVEVTAWGQRREVHIVALGVDLDCPVFEAFLASIRQARVDRLATVIDYLRGRGMDLPRDAGLCPGSLVASRSHLAASLIAAGYAPNHHQVFRHFLGDHCLQTLSAPAYPSPAAAAAAIRAAKGIALLAHPAHYNDLSVVISLYNEGELDGLESLHPRCSPQWQRWLQELCLERGGIESCGTDFHHPGRYRPGDCHLPKARLQPLLERLAIE